MSLLLQPAAVEADDSRDYEERSFLRVQPSRCLTGAALLRVWGAARSCVSLNRIVNLFL